MASLLGNTRFRLAVGAVLLAIVGVAVWLGANQLSGYGAAVLSQLALFIARKIWLVIRARQSN